MSRTVFNKYKVVEYIPPPYPSVVKGDVFEFEGHLYVLGHDELLHAITNGNVWSRSIDSCRRMLTNDKCYRVKAFYVIYEEI